MSIERIIENKTVTRNFVVIVVGSLVLLSMARVFVIPWVFPISVNPKSAIEEFVLSVSDNLIGTIFITVAAAWLLYWLSPPEDQDQYALSSVAAAGKAISKLLRNAALNTDEWIFQGGSGTWLRAETIPALSGEARRESSIIKLCIQIIDPRDQMVCQAYTDYRRGSDQADWDLERTRAELLATIVTAFIVSSREPNLRIELYLRKTFSRFRFDLSNDYVVVTTSDSSAPAIKAPKHSHYYSQYKQDLLQACATATKLELNNEFVTQNKVGLASVTEADVKGILEASQLNLTFPIEDSLLSHIVQRAKSPRSKYA